MIWFVETVRTNAHVTRVLVDPKTLHATGVEYLDMDGRLVRVQTRKEVILSAGAINSPKILMLSGIGPADHLMQRGIKVIKDLPVSSFIFVLKSRFLFCKIRFVGHNNNNYFWHH